ncbi:MAG: hypothetical protein HYV68_00400 [Candidatus Taylorbacteria bacterium]|nr:hypothetical protein [Candidatus Taylorbacteria bacterium]
MFRRPKNNRRTVAEFLVLAAFIVAVGTMIAFGLDVLKKQAADSKRASEINELARALEEYYDSHAEYPLRLEDLVSDGRLLYLPTPAPYGGTVLQYVYVPLGNGPICTGGAENCFDVKI